MILDKLAREIEALLFAADHPVSVELLCSITGSHEDSVMQALDRIEESLQMGGHSLLIKHAGGGYRMVTDPSLGEKVAMLFEDRRPGRLTRAALETLSVIAYSQPCTRADVEDIRGVSCDSSLRTLLERGMIRICGRQESPGRPLVYATTREFLEYFGLNDLDHLPRAGEISQMLDLSPDELEQRRIDASTGPDGETGREGAGQRPE